MAFSPPDNVLIESIFFPGGEAFISISVSVNFCFSF